MEYNTPVRVTKYPQSCLLLEKSGHLLLIDPGTIATAQYPYDQFGKVEVVLYTHAHADHFDAAIVDEIVRSGAQIFANADVVGQIGAERATVVENGEEFVAGPFQVRAHDLPHCKMQDGSAGPPNTGFIVDGTFFDPGDGIETTGVTVPDVALPIAGPSINLANAAAFANALGAKRIIPMHYDYFHNDPHEFARRHTQAKVFVLEAGESVEF